MGCILSTRFFSNRGTDTDTITTTPLLIHYKCFVCNETFPSNKEYNKHISKCRMT